jgi:hypothetical protein
VNITKKIREVILDSVKKIGPEIKLEVAKCKFGSRHQNVKEHHNEKSECIIRKYSSFRMLENNSESKLLPRSN